MTFFERLNGFAGTKEQLVQMYNGAASEIASAWGINPHSRVASEFASDMSIYTYIYMMCMGLLGGSPTWTYKNRAGTVVNYNTLRAMVDAMENDMAGDPSGTWVIPELFQPLRAIADRTDALIVGGPSAYSTWLADKTDQSARVHLYYKATGSRASRVPVDTIWLRGVMNIEFVHASLGEELQVQIPGSCLKGILERARTSANGAIETMQRMTNSDLIDPVLYTLAKTLNSNTVGDLNKSFSYAVTKSMYTIGNGYRATSEPGVNAPEDSLINKLISGDHPSSLVWLI